MTTEIDRPDDATPATAKTVDTADAKVFAPAAMPSATWPGLLVGIALLALAAIAVRDLLVDIGWLSGEQWIRAALDRVAAIRWWTWMWPVAVLAILAGLFLLWHAVRPRQRTHLSLAGYQVMWTRRVDLARRCSAAVSEVPGVDHASTVVGRRTVRVSVNAGPDVDTDEIDRVVGTVVSAVDAPLTARVGYVRAPGGGDRR
ncbi:DUF6286 domain-containing protein [Gordonia sp. NPDC003424]